MNSLIKTIQKRISLRTFLVLPFLVQIFVVVGLVGWLSLRNGQRAVNDVASQLRSEVTARIHEKLSTYISVPPLVNQITANSIATEQIDIKNSRIFARHFYRQLQTFPNVSFHYFGDTQGEFVTARRLSSGEIQVGLENPSTNSQINYFTPDSQGDRTQLAEVVPNTFDPRTRPWYKAAVAAGKPTWTGIYRHFVTKGLTISATHPVYDRQGQLLGVLSTDFVFLQVNKFLSSLKIGYSGQTFIMERSGELVSTSTKDSIFAIKGSKTERIRAENSNNTLIKESIRQLVNQFGNLSSIQSDRQIEFEVDGAKHFLQVSTLKDDMGIDWLIVVVIPESDFMEQIESNTYITVWLCLLALFIATLSGIYTSRKITKPVLRLSQAAKSLTNHAQNQQSLSIPEEGARELRGLARAFNSMSQQLLEAFTQLQYSAYHDSLTNLPNRAAFMKCLENAIVQHQAQPDFLFAVLFLDLDRFKLVNDSLGHLAGDQLLVAFAKRLKECLRTADVVARFGGDEFAILLLDMPTIEFAVKMSDQIQEALNFPFDLSNNEIFTTVSIGIVSSLTFDEQPENLMRDADIALYQAKLQGKACSKFFDVTMHAQAIERMQLEMDLRRGINQEEFLVYYQPIISLTNLQIVGFEALLRWNHPIHGFLNPSRFLSVLEDTGMIVQLDLWVLKEACFQLRNWQLAFPGSGLKYISVNLSTKLFLQPELSIDINRVLSETGLPHSQLRLELVESTLMESSEIARGLMEQLRNSGICIDIDDFGTGYSSFSYLCRFPLNSLKIDRSFIMLLDREHIEIVRAIIDLAKNLGMQITAEGVETPLQLEILQELGCDRAQGYFFSRPTSVGAATELLAKKNNGNV